MTNNPALLANFVDNAVALGAAEWQGDRLVATTGDQWTAAAAAASANNFVMANSKTIGGISFTENLSQDGTGSIKAGLAHDASFSDTGKAEIGTDVKVNAFKPGNFAAAQAYESAMLLSNPAQIAASAAAAIAGGIENSIYEDEVDPKLLAAVETGKDKAQIDGKGSGEDDLFTAIGLLGNAALAVPFVLATAEGYAAYKHFTSEGKNFNGLSDKPLKLGNNQVFSGVNKDGNTVDVFTNPNEKDGKPFTLDKHGQSVDFDGDVDSLKQKFEPIMSRGDYSSVSPTMKAKRFVSGLTERFRGGGSGDGDELGTRASGGKTASDPTYIGSGKPADKSVDVAADGGKDTDYQEKDTGVDGPHDQKSQGTPPKNKYAEIVANSEAFSKLTPGEQGKVRAQAHLQEAVNEVRSGAVAELGGMVKDAEDYINLEYYILKKALFN